MTHDLHGLDLDRPLVCFDLETTGLDFHEDRIVECACVKLHPDGTTTTWHHYFNPERQISDEVLEILQIDPRMLLDKPLFKDLASDLFDFLKGCDLLGFNIIKFDIPFLEAEFQSVGFTVNLSTDRHLIDSKNIFFHYHPRNLSAAVLHYNGHPHADAHSGIADTTETLKVFLNQLSAHPDLPRTPKTLDEFCRPRNENAYDREGKILWDPTQDSYVLSFGKHKNKPLQKLLNTAPDYLTWILKSDFAPAVKSFIHTALQTGTTPTERIPPAAS